MSSREGLCQELCSSLQGNLAPSFFSFFLKNDMIWVVFPGNELSEETIDWRCERGGQCLPWPRPQKDPGGDEVPV